MGMEKLQASAQPSRGKQTLRKQNGCDSEKDFTEEQRAEKPRISDTEIKLSIGNTSIMAEKQTLIESSPYFASLLRFHDVSMNAVNMIPPDNVNLGNFVAVLYTLSNPSVKLNINASNLWDFVVLSKYFQLDYMEKECLDVLRNLLPTFEMDELCQHWRRGHAYAFEEVTSLVLTGISLKMESALRSREFLDLTAAELVALLSDDGFLPLTEVDVCKAIIAWIELDPENRKKSSVLKPILDQVVWDVSTSKLIYQPFIDQRVKPGKAPKRADTGRQRCWDRGIVIGDYLYCVEGLFKSDRDFYRICLKTVERTSWESITPEYESNDEPAQYGFCHLTLSGRDYIAFLLSSWMDIHYQYYGHGFRELVNTMALYDTEKEEWTFLPDLPLPRIDTAMIQCGTFLYVVGGTALKPYQSGKGDGRHCYRLDLSLFADGQDNFKGEWERIADLNRPRTEHSIDTEHGRVVVHGGRTEKEVDEEGYKTLETARCSEAYDTILNSWTMFGFS